MFQFVAVIEACIFLMIVYVFGVILVPLTMLLGYCLQEWDPITHIMMSSNNM